jgi:hypothetical protein
MSTATTWTTEFETSGQVVFPQRLSRLLIRGAIGVVLMSSSLWTIAERIRADDMGGTMGVLRLTALSAFIYLVGVTAWQLATRRPVVTINGDGIAVGKKMGKLTWDKIARIDDPSGIPGIRTVQIQPVDRHGSTALGIPQDNVLELAELSQWLRTLHARQHPT